MQPPAGPPVWMALSCLPPATPPPMSVDHLAERGAHGHLDQPGVLHLAGQGEDLGAAALGGADAAEPVGPVTGSPPARWRRSPRC